MRVARAALPASNARALKLSRLSARNELFSQFSALLREPPVAAWKRERERGSTKDQSVAATAFTTQLVRVDAHFASQNSRVLCGNCPLLPKLHHVHVAARALRGFEVPTNSVRSELDSPLEAALLVFRTCKHCILKVATAHRSNSGSPLALSCASRSLVVLSDAGERELSVEVHVAR